MGNYFVYILTNPDRTVLYVGVTNDLIRRLAEHKENAGNRKSFTGRYYCYNLIYYEKYDYVNEAIAREKRLKRFKRKEKEDLIVKLNPDWEFLNMDFQ